MPAKLGVSTVRRGGAGCEIQGVLGTQKRQTRDTLRRMLGTRGEFTMSAMRGRICNRSIYALSQRSRTETEQAQMRQVLGRKRRSAAAASKWQRSIRGKDTRQLKELAAR